MGRKAKAIIAAVLVALIATAFSFFRETFLSRVIFIGVWLVVFIVWVLVKVKGLAIGSKAVKRLKTPRKK